MKITQNELSQVKEIENLFKKAQEIFNQFPAELQEQIFKLHTHDEYTLNHCIRWGLKASEETYDELSVRINKKQTVKEFMEMKEPMDEITCCDKDIDSEFYLYVKEPDGEPDPDFANIDKFEAMLIDRLQVTEVIDEDTIEVGLYELFEDPEIIKYAQKHIYPGYDADEISEMLFDDTVACITAGTDKFASKMVACFEHIENQEKNKPLHVMIRGAASRLISNNTDVINKDNKERDI